MVTKSPLVLWLELTEACQYKCRFCYNYWRDQPPAQHVHMSEAIAGEVTRFVRRCSQTYWTGVALAGGDPTAHPDFLNIATRISQVADETTVVTHGGRLGSETLAGLSVLRNVAVQFSIPSLNAERHRFLTGNGRLDRVLVALATCRELAIPVSLSVVLTSRNADDLTDIVHLAAEVEAEYLIVNRFLASGRGALYDEDFALPTDAFDAALAAAREIASARDVRLSVSGFHPEIRMRKALEPKLTVSTGGELRLCSLVPDTIATLNMEPIDVVEIASAYWRSERPLEGCYCASQRSGQPAEPRPAKSLN